MRRLGRVLVAMAASLGAMGSAWAGPADCRLHRIAELPIERVGHHIFTQAVIDGRPARVMLDTGAWKSTMFPAFARRLGHSLSTLPDQTAEGIGGASALGVVHVDHMRMGDWQADDLGLLVVEDARIGRGIDMILGRDVFNQADVELDYAHGVVRLFQDEGCEEVPLAYWAHSYSQADLRRLPGQLSPLAVRVRINDVETWALLDTGAGSTLLDSRVAGRAGVHAESPGVTDGVVSHGIGRGTVPTHIGTFDTVTIGDETVRNVRIAFGEWGDHEGRDDERMILGDDFLWSHRIMIARGHHKIYFTNVSHPVFTPVEPGKAP